MLEISLLGSMEVRIDGSPVDVPGDIARRILAGLATEQPVTADRLIDIAWGSEPPRSAKAALQTQISRLRNRLGRDAIAGSGSGYSLAHAEVDIDRFQRLIDTADPDALTAAVGLIRGEPLADFVDSAELTGTRRALAERALMAHLRYSEALTGMGRAEEAIPVLERLTGSSPLFEPAWMALARAMHAAGRQSDAIAALDRYRRAAAEAGLEPSPAVSALEEEVFGPVPVRTPAARRAGVNTRRSSFVGRDEELDALLAALSTSRVVTVTGPGGMGKTRIAEAAALRCESDLPGGAVEVELDTDMPADAVADAVARAFGVRAGEDPIDAVASAVGGDRTLLLLDNCEHLIDSVRDTVTRLLAASPNLTILSTSRQPISLEGETLFPLEPLDPVRAGVRLFLDRAGEAGADMDSSDRVSVEALCRRLDGMPLAIEMAAARARTVTPAELIELLEDSHVVLESSRRAQRHRTLDALVDWSYQRLEPEDQRVFRTLGVFAGGFEAGDAATLLDRTTADTVRVLSRLVDRSMLQSSRTAGVTVFQMLETLRVAARDRLVAAGEDEVVQVMHGNWAATVSMEAATLPNHHDEAALVDRLVRAIPDITAAHRRAAARADLDLEIRLLGPLFPFVYLVLPPGIAEPASATLGRVADPDHPLLPWLDSVAAAYAIAAGHPDRARERLATARARPHGTDAWPAWFMSVDIAVYHGELEAAAIGNAQVMRLSDDHSVPLRPMGWTDGLITEALIASYSGRHEDAIDAARRSLVRARAHGAPTYVAFSEYAFGEVHQDLDPGLALDHLRLAVDFAASAGAPFIEGIARTTIASVLARNGRFDEALCEFGDLIDLLERTGARVHLWTAVRNLVVLLGSLEAWDEVALLLGATADRVQPTYGDEAARLAATERLARDRYDDFPSTFDEGRLRPVVEVGSMARQVIARLSRSIG